MKDKALLLSQHKRRCDMFGSFYAEQQDYEPGSKYVDPVINNIEGSVVFTEFASDDALQTYPAIYLYALREIFVYDNYKAGITNLQPSLAFINAATVLAGRQHKTIDQYLEFIKNEPSLIQTKKEYFAKYLQDTLDNHNIQSRELFEKLLGVSRGTFTNIFKYKADPQHALCTNICLFFDYDIDKCKKFFANLGIVLFQDLLPDAYIMSYIKKGQHGMKNLCSDLKVIYDDYNMVRQLQSLDPIALDHGYLDKKKSYNNGHINECVNLRGVIDYKWAWDCNPIFGNPKCIPYYLNNSTP